MPTYPTSPSFPLTFPSTPKFSRFQIRERWSTPFTESPFTLDQQVFQYSGSNKIEWEAELPPMLDGDSDIDTWIQFLLELQGRYGTFTLNIQAHTTIDYVSGMTSLPTTWRSRDDSHSWEFSRRNVMEGVVIRAVEA